MLLTMAKFSSTFDQDQEEALLALVDHRSREVEHLRRRLAYYQSQLEESEQRLKDSQSKLARLRSSSSINHVDTGTGSDNVDTERRSLSPDSTKQPQSNRIKSENVEIISLGPDSVKQPHSNGTTSVKIESTSPVRASESTSSTKPKLLIPSVVPKVSVPTSTKTSLNTVHSPQVSLSASKNCLNDGEKARAEKSVRVSNEREVVQTPAIGTKRKFEHKEHKELIPLVCNSSRPCTIRCDASNHISSQHKRKLRTIALCPVNDQLFVTSALDGVVNLWQVQSKGSFASLLSRTDCSSQQRRWPEDVAWHPHGNSVFSIYNADGGDSQISVLDLNRTQGRDKVTFLEDKPHVKGIINNISFMPWEKTCFVTGGSDHGVVLWDEKDDNVWKPKALHRNFHSSAVMGVAGMQQKNIVLSSGADKRIIGFDVDAGRAEFKHQIDTKCMSVLPNPCDFNLFMVHAGTLEKQLRLFDIRLRQTEIHYFGWKQESSESQSALINQSWSPDGLYITSGSADPTIHIFDIRYNASKPSQSIRAHQKRVFKVVWLNSLPLLVSISSDLHIGLHKIT